MIYSLDQFNQNLKYQFPFQIFQDSQNSFISNFSNQSIGLFQYDSSNIRMINLFEDMHKKRIYEIFAQDKILYSCSGDGTAKIFDMNSNKLIKKFTVNNELFSIAKQDKTLVCGSEGKLFIWDLNKMSLRSTFDETHSDDILSVKFHQSEQNVLISGSLDGILSVLNLSKQTEDEALQIMVRLDQPINQCNFFNQNYAYAQTTINTIQVVDLKSSTIIKDILLGQNLHVDEGNTYMIDAQNFQDKISYFYANYQNIYECYLDDPGKIQNQMILNQVETIRCIKKISNDKAILGSDKSSFLIQKIKRFQDNFDAQAQDLFNHDEKFNLQQGKFKNKYQKNQFKPY